VDEFDHDGYNELTEPVVDWFDVIQVPERS